MERTATLVVMDRGVTSTALPEGVAEYLRNLIHRGGLAPGDRLPPERELAQQLGVARLSLRAAIKILQDGGYIEVRRGQKGGAFVTELSKPFAEWRAKMQEHVQEIDDITEFRIALESHAASLAADRRTRADLTALRGAVADIAKSDGRGAFRSADSRFHDRNAHAARNARLESSIHAVRGELFSPHDLLDYAEPIQESRHDHQAIYDAIRDRRADRAAELMREHILRTREQLRVIVFGASGAGPRQTGGQ
ncbi:FadR/GntR family transcriptional regulator [Streptomyces aureus]|uniref:FadR/GntR family transcriptional regulator n=1 Tax=Streptomyces aureus TaxID=193461 RepID=A0ABV4SM19_9ACTN